MSFIRKSLVPCAIDYSQQTEVLCVHGDCKPEPHVELTVEVEGQKYLMTVGVIMTRSQGKLQAQAGVQPLPDLCDSLCKAGTKGPRKTRRQWRLEKHTGTPVSHELPDNALADVKWEIPEDIAMLQLSDPVLKSVLTKVLASASHTVKVGGTEYVLHNDVLYQEEIPGSRRLVVPLSCRPLVLHLAHTIPWAGHLGHYKTYLRLGYRFFWPSMYTDVQRYCKACPECQKTCAVCKSDRAPLQAMPVITTPFKRIAMDIVGPLEKSSAGYQYILVVCDYATRYLQKRFPSGQ